MTIKLTAVEIMRYGAETEREKVLIDYIKKREDAVEIYLKNAFNDYEECVDDIMGDIA